MSFLIGVVFVSLAYIFGARIGRLAPDEVVSGSQYILLVREACVLAAVAFVAFMSGAAVHYLAPLLMLGLMFVWRKHEQIYPWLFAILLFFSGASLVTTTVLLFVANAQ